MTVEITAAMIILFTLGLAVGYLAGRLLKKPGNLACLSGLHNHRTIDSINTPDGSMKLELHRCRRCGVQRAVYIQNGTTRKIPVETYVKCACASVLENIFG